MAMRALACLGMLASACALPTQEQPDSFFSLGAVDITGARQGMEQYRGNVVLVVNVATE